MNPIKVAVILFFLTSPPSGWASQPEEAESIVPKVLYQSPFSEYTPHKNFQRKSWYDANKQVQSSTGHGGHQSMSDMNSEQIKHSEKPMQSPSSPSTHEHKHHD